MKTVEEVNHLALSIRNYPLQAVEDTLYPLGWSRLGNGNFSVVYGHPESDYVIKVCRSASTDSWPFFAKYCRDNVNDPVVSKYLPKVHSFYRYEGNGRHYVAVLDRLTPIITESRWSVKREEGYSNNQLIELVHLCMGFKTGIFVAEELINELFPETYDHPSWDWREKIQSSSIFDSWHPAYIAGERIRADLMDFCTIDVHYENVMRSGADFIVTDPVSYTDSDVTQVDL